MMLIFLKFDFVFIIKEKCIENIWVGGILEKFLKEY